MLRVSLVLLSVLVSSAAVTVGADPLQVGVTAPTGIVATFLPGGWVDRRQDLCPVLGHRDASKIAIFAKDSNARVLHLAKAIDDVVAADPSLKWSFLFVSHENNPVPSPEEWNAQLDRLQQRSKDQQIKNLALGLMIRLPETAKPTRAKRHVGVFDSGDVVLMLIRPGSNHRGVIRHVEVLDSDKLDPEEIERITRELTDAITRTAAVR